ncbi:MAG: hypothetical protein AAGJ28_17455 [Pseudomonadota bacterium]
MSSARILVAALIVTFSAAVPLCAHIPHDTSEALSEASGTAMAIVRGEFYRSSDDGVSWHRETRGVTCPAQRSHREHLSKAVAVVSAPGAGVWTYIACGGQLLRSQEDTTGYLPLAEFSGEAPAALIPSPDFATDRVFLARVPHGPLLRSADGGRSWTALTGLPEVTALRWSAEGPLAAGLDGTITRGADGGAHWTPLGHVADAEMITDLIPIRSGETPGFLLATNAGLLRVTETGDGLNVTGTELNGRRITGLARIGPSAEPVFFATTWRDGVYRSRDGGDSWEQVAAGLHPVPQAVSYDDPDYTGLIETSAGNLLLSGFAGLYRSTDGGDSWARIDVTLGHVVALDIRERSEGGQLLGLVTYAGGVMLSEDGGQSWRFDQSGLDSRRTSFAFADRTGEDLGMFSGNRRWIAQSPAPGQRWQETNLELLDPSFSKDAQAPTPVIIRSSPDYARDGIVYAGLFPHGVLRSTDRGATYDLVFDSNAPTWALALSPDFARDGTVFATAAGDLHGSRDGGDTWERLWQSAAPRAELAVSPRFGTDGMILAGADETLVLSRDGGASWQNLDLPASGAAITGLALAPEPGPEHRILLQLEGADLAIGTLDGNAVTWQTAEIPAPGFEFSRLTYIDGFDLFAFSPDYANDRTIYGGGGDQVLVSRDGGERWTLLPMPPRRYEAENVFTEVRGGPVRLDPTWNTTRPPIPAGQSKTDRLNRLWVTLRHWRGIDRMLDSGAQTVRSKTPGAKARVDFSGDALQLIGPRGPGRGQFRVWLDGNEAAVIDQSADEIAYQQVLYEITDPGPGSHRLEIEVLAGPGGNPGGWVEIDAFDVLR